MLLLWILACFFLIFVFTWKCFKPNPSFNNRLFMLTWLFLFLMLSFSNRFNAARPKKKQTSYSRHHASSIRFVFTENLKVRLQCGKRVRVMLGWPIPLRLHSSTLHCYALKLHKGFTTSALWNKLPVRLHVCRAWWQLCTFLQWIDLPYTFADLQDLYCAC